MACSVEPFGHLARIVVNGRPVGEPLPARVAPKWARWLEGAEADLREALAPGPGRPQLPDLQVGAYSPRPSRPDPEGAAEALRIREAIRRGEKP